MKLLRILNTGVDVFRTIASQIYNKEADQITDTERQHAKQVHLMRQKLGGSNEEVPWQNMIYHAW